MTAALTMAGQQGVSCRALKHETGLLLLRWITIFPDCSFDQIQWLQKKSPELIFVNLNAEGAGLYSCFTEVATLDSNSQCLSVPEL